MEGKQLWGWMELPSLRSSEWALQLRPGGGCRGDLPHGQGASIAPGAVSAWHSSSADFSPGDSEVIAGLWQAYPAQPLLWVFCCFIFADVAMPLVLPPRTDAASGPASPLPPQPCHRGGRTPAPPTAGAGLGSPLPAGARQERKDTVPPIFCKTWLWKEVLYL